MHSCIPRSRCSFLDDTSHTPKSTHGWLENGWGTICGAHCTTRQTAVLRLSKMNAVCLHSGLTNSREGATRRFWGFPGKNTRRGYWGRGSFYYYLELSNCYVPGACVTWPPCVCTSGKFMVVCLALKHEKRERGGRGAGGFDSLMRRYCTCRS